MHNSSKSIAVIVRNSMAYPQTLRKKVLVAKVVATNWVPKPQMRPEMMERLDEAQGIQPQRLTIEQRHEKLFKKLDLSGLELWPPKLVKSAQSFLPEYHDIFCSGSQRAWLYPFN